MDDTVAVTGEHAPLAERHADMAGAGREELCRRHARGLERVHREIGEPRGFVLVRREVVHEGEHGRVQGLDRGGIQHGHHTVPPCFAERPADHVEGRLELTGEDLRPRDALRVGRDHLHRQAMIRSGRDGDLVPALEVHHDQRRARGRIRSGAEARHADSGGREALRDAPAVGVGPDAADHPHLAAQPARSQRLIGTLAAQVHEQRAAGDRLAGVRQPW